MVRRALAVLACAVLAANARAQSADPVFTGDWTWTPETLAAEATGLGGAYVTTLRGGDALYWSPAALTFDTGLDVRVSAGARPGFGVVLHGDKLHIAAGVRRTYSRAHHAGGFDAARQVFESGHLAVAVDQAAVGLGFRAGRLRLGASLAAGPFHATGVWSRFGPAEDGTPALVEARYDYQGVREWQFGGASSAILELLQTHPMARNHARVGVAVSFPTLLRTPRYRRSRLLLRPAALATPAVMPPALDGEGPHLQTFRQPMTMSLGAEAHVSLFTFLRSVRVALGADWTDYDRILETARANQVGPPASSLSLDDDRAWTFGGGLEAVHPLLRVRVGMRERARHRLTTAAPAVLRQKPPRTTFGASRDALIAGKRIQVDVDSTSSFDDLVVALRLLW